MMAVVSESPFGSGRWYSKALGKDEAASYLPVPTGTPITPLPKRALSFRVQAYGMDEHWKLFSNRQLTALVTFSDLVSEMRGPIERDAVAAGMADDGVGLRDGGAGARAYAEAVSVYLACAVDKLADYCSTICTWHNSCEKMRNVFSRQAIPMDRAGVPSLPDKVYVATLVGTDLDPSSFKNPPFLSGKVNTLWGEMAYQLCLQRGDPAPYSIIRSADSKSVAPGTEKLVQLFDAIGPCVILIDEFVAYARNLYGADSRNLPAGTFGNVLSFMVE